MSFLHRARDLEAKLAGTLDRTVGGLVRSGAREPLEVVHAILDAAQQEVQSSGRGRRVFPFNVITLTVLAPSRDARARFEAVFADGPSLHDRLVAHLESTGCSMDDVELDVTVKYDNHSRRNWRSPEFHIEFARVAKAERRAPPTETAPPRVEVTVLTGAAERRTYVLTPSPRIDIGRGAEVRDRQHRLIRTNHVAFVEGSDSVNQSVSRRHAHIAYEPVARCFRLRDDGSEHGTSIVRHGRNLAVPRGARGVRLEAADEIVLGDARVRVKFAGFDRR
jgi:FHA domain